MPAKPTDERWPKRRREKRSLPSGDGELGALAPLYGRMETVVQPEDLVRVLGIGPADADDLCDAMVGAEVSGWGLIEATNVLERASAMMPLGCGAPIELVPDSEDVVLAVYVNVGDAYSPTLLWDNGTGEFVVGCWGDVLEEWEAENGNVYPTVDELTADLRADRDNLNGPETPEDDDVVTTDGREFRVIGGRPGRVAFVVGEDETFAVKCRDYCNENNCWPNVWRQDERGDVTLLSEDGAGIEQEVEGIDVRLQCRADGWALRTGDAQYDSDHRGAWGTGYLTHNSDCRALAEELIDEAKDHAAQG